MLGPPISIHGIAVDMTWPWLVGGGSGSVGLGFFTLWLIMLRGPRLSPAFAEKPGGTCGAETGLGLGMGATEPGEGPTVGCWGSLAFGGWGMSDAHVTYGVALDERRLARVTWCRRRTGDARGGLQGALPEDP